MFDILLSAAEHIVTQQSPFAGQMVSGLIQEVRPTKRKRKRTDDKPKSKEIKLSDGVFYTPAPRRTK